MTAIEVVQTLGISFVISAGTVWLGAKTVAGKWLNAHFTSRLEALKLEGQKQLEGMRQEHASYLEQQRFERAGLLDRAAKLNQREFEVIPDIWKHATEAHFAISRLISIWQESPDVGRMSEPQFEEFIRQSRLEDWQKEEIRQKDRFERTRYYSDIEAVFRLQDASTALVGFNRASANGNIFLHPETHTKINEFGDPMRNAYRHWSLNVRLRADGDPIEKGEADNPVKLYRERGSDLYEKLARYLRERYWVTPQGEAL